MMNHDALAIGSDTKPPILFPGEYSQWKDRFLDFVDRSDYADEIMDSILHGPPEPPMQDVPANPNATPPIIAHKTLKPKSAFTAAEKKIMKGDQLAKSYLLMSIPNDIYMNIDSQKRTAKTMWEEIEKFMLGTKIGTQLKITNCISQYESFKAKEGEKLSETYTRFVHLVNELSKNNIRKTKIENNVKFVSNLLPEWRRPANQIKHSKYLAELDLHEVYETLLQDEEEILEAMETKKKTADPIALVARESPNPSRLPAYEAFPELPDEEFAYDPEIAQFQQQLVLLTKDFQRRFSRKPNNNLRYASGNKNHERKVMFEPKK